MAWKTILVVVVLVTVGYFLGSKYPGWLSKLSAGTVSA